MKLVNVPLETTGGQPIILTLKPYTDKGVSSAIAMFRTWEPYNTILILSLLQEGDTFLDIGAHIGYFSVIAAQKVGETGRVFAFEPDHENASLLSHNLARNGFEHRSKVFSYAIGSTNGTERLYKSLHNHGAHQLAHPYRDGIDLNGTVVKTVSLDSLLETEPEIQHVQFIKMDIQGFETKALRGMNNLIEKNKGHLVMLLEFSPSLLIKFEEEGDGIEGFLSWLQSNATAVFFVRRTVNTESATSLFHINHENLKLLSQYLLDQSERDQEDRCADLCCVFSTLAAEKLMAKASKKPASPSLANQL